VETGQDHVLIGAEDVFEHPEYLYVHRFRLRSFKDRIGYAVEAAVHF
jgi:hypothetical protein